MLLLPLPLLLRACIVGRKWCRCSLYPRAHAVIYAACLPVLIACGSPSPFLSPSPFFRYALSNGYSHLILANNDVLVADGAITALTSALDSG